MKRRGLLTTLGTTALAGCTAFLGESADDKAFSGYVWHYAIPGKELSVSEGSLYAIETTPDGREFEEAEGSGRIFSLDTENGDRRWTYGPTSRYFGHTRLLVEDGVYYQTSDDESQWVSALDRDGAERWAGSEGADDYQGTLEHVIGGRTYIVDPTGGPTLRAIDGATGKKQWEFSDALSVHFDTDSETAPETAYVALDDVAALNTADGSERWRYEYGTPWSFVEAVSDGVAYITDDGDAITAIADGEQLWQRSGGSRPRIDQVAGDLVLAQDRTQVYALDAATGEQRWATPYRGSLSVYDERFFLVGSMVWAFALDDGTEIWNTDLGSEAESSQIVLDDPSFEPSLFVQTDSELHRIRLNSGGEIAQTWTPGEQIHDFAVSEGIIISTDSGIYALNP